MISNFKNPTHTDNLLLSFNTGILIYALGGIISSAVQIGQSISAKENKRNNSIRLKVDSYWLLCSSLYLAASIATIAYLKNPASTTLIETCLATTFLIAMSEASISRQPATYALQASVITYSSGVIGAITAFYSFAVRSIGSIDTPPIYIYNHA